MKPRLLVLSIHPAPYRDPTFYEVFRRSKVEIAVRFYFPSDDGHRQWGWALLPFPSKNLAPGLPFFNKDKFHLSIANELKRKNYDVVLIPGYSRATSAAAIVLSEILNIPFVLSVDSFRYGEGLSKKITWRTATRRHILKRAAAIWVPGKAARDQLESQNIPHRKIFEGAYCFDSISLHSSMVPFRDKRSDMRKSLGLTEDSFVFLTVGNMIKTRRYRTLAKAFDKAAVGLVSDLIMIGDGPDRPSIDSLIQSSGIRHIHLLHSVPFHELFAYYAASDAYVHPGADAFSTATELAAIAGLPIVATPGVGYVYDLIKQDVQPLLSDIDDEDALQSNLHKLIVNRKFATELGGHTEVAATRRNAQWAAEELENAVFYAMNER
jgi:glycosyltransferase involved in cell wall biosynthesis